MVHSELIYNPNCFLIHNNSILAPDDWNDVSSLSILSSSSSYELQLVEYTPPYVRTFMQQLVVSN